MTYKPGSFFLTSISGAAGFAIGLGQALCGDPSRYSHAGIVISETGDVVEAEPGGARIGNLSEYAGHALLVSDGPVRREMADVASGKIYWDKSHRDFETYMRREVVYQAMNFVGIGYSPLDYLALALLHLHLPSAWVRKRVQRSGRVICSQLTDAVYARAGIHLFDDGRLPGDVMPSDLAAWAEDWAGKQ